MDRVMLSWSAEESSARGYWVAMLGLFVTILVAIKTHSVELVQSLLVITFLWFLLLVLVLTAYHVMDAHGLLDKKLKERKMLRLSG